jgi:hypothetical protein
LLYITSYALYTYATHRPLAPNNLNDIVLLATKTKTNKQTKMTNANAHYYMETRPEKFEKKETKNLTYRTEKTVSQLSDNARKNC